MEPINQFVYVVNGMTGIVVTVPGTPDMGLVRYKANAIHNKHIKSLDANLEFRLNRKNLSVKEKAAIEREQRELKGKRSPKHYEVIDFCGEIDLT